MAGTLQLVGTVKVHLFSLKELSLAMSPTGFNAALEVKTTIAFDASDSEKTSDSKSITLFSAPVPGAGLSIPEIFELGCTVGIDAGFDISFDASVAFTVGLTAALPEGGKILLDLANMDNSGVTGLDGVNVTPVVTIDSKNVTIHGDVYLSPKVSFGISILSLGKADAALSLQLPKISADAVLLDSECPL